MTNKQIAMAISNLAGWHIERAQLEYERTYDFKEGKEDRYDAVFDAAINANEYVWSGNEGYVLAKFDAAIERATFFRNAYYKEYKRYGICKSDWTYYRIYRSQMIKYRTRYAAIMEYGF